MEEEAGSNLDTSSSTERDQKANSKNNNNKDGSKPKASSTPIKDKDDDNRKSTETRESTNEKEDSQTKEEKIEPAVTNALENLDPNAPPQPSSVALSGESYLVPIGGAEGGEGGCEMEEDPDIEDKAGRVGLSGDEKGGQGGGDVDEGDDDSGNDSERPSTGKKGEYTLRTLPIFGFDARDVVPAPKLEEHDNRREK